MHLKSMKQLHDVEMVAISLKTVHHAVHISWESYD